MAQVARERVEQATRKGEYTVLSSLLQETGQISARDVANAVKSKDAVALEIIRSTGAKLGEALAILVDILNPERIVIGGLAMRFGEMLLGPARTALGQEALPESARICGIAPAALGEAIGDVAAICVAQDSGSVLNSC
jgi:glucokinase